MEMDTQKQSPEVFSENGVFKNLAEFTGKHRRRIIFFNKRAQLCRKLQF